MALTIAQAFIVSLFLQSALYGFYLGTLAYCLRWLVFEDEGWKLRPLARLNLPMMSTTLLLFLISTADIAFSVLNMQISMAGNELKIVIYGVTIAGMQDVTLLVTDAIMIFRCWAIYNRSWKVACFLALLWLAGVVTAFLTLYWGVRLDPRREYLCPIFYIFNFANNCCASLAIIHMILSFARYSHDRSSYVWVTGRILAESGIMYTLTSLAFLITQFATKESLPVTIVDTLNFSMASIAFNLVLIRLGQHRASSAQHDMEKWTSMHENLDLQHV